MPRQHYKYCRGILFDISLSESFLDFIIQIFIIQIFHMRTSSPELHLWDFNQNISLLMRSISSLRYP